MKNLLLLFVVIIFISACKKTIKQDILQNDALAGNKNIAAGISSEPAYGWRSLPVPVMTQFPNNNAAASIRIIPVNGEIYCLVADAPANSYKLNNSTKQWEPFNDTRNIFQPFKDHKQYFFSLGTKIYFGFEWFDFTHLNNFGCVDVLTGTVTSLANYPGRGVSGFSAFIANGKAYVAGGSTLDYGLQNQFYEYNFATNTWTDKGNFPLGAREGATTVVIDNLVYMGMGTDENNQKRNDWRVYSPSTGISGILASFPGAKRSAAHNFVINNSIYLGLGRVGNNASNTDFWKYSPSSNTWTRQVDVPGETRIDYAGTFAIGSTGYLVKGGLNKFWKFSNSLF